MGKDFPDPGSYAHHDPDEDAAFPSTFVKIVPSVPASQSERPQLRPVLPIAED